jgi:NAD(P)-binding Rossmann-like domain
MNENVTVVGGGPGGLAVATLLARGGRRVKLLERASLGGRAQTATLEQCLVNLGPHALYRGGAARRVLRSLGIEPKGFSPPASGSLAWCGGSLHALPAGPVSLLSSTLMTLPEKLELGRLMARLPRLDPGEGSVNDWLGRAVTSARVADVVRAILRVTTYTNHCDALPARRALAQLRLALAKNVLYLEGGWQSLVGSLRDAAVKAGVELHQNTPVHALPDGEVVLAVPPRDAAELVPGLDVTGLVPVRAACLDLVLSELPQPRRTFSLGIDVPTYLSVHSNVVPLGPHHVVAVAKYLGPSDRGADALAELEAVTEAMQPGFRGVTLARRFMPELTVMHAVPGQRLPVRTASGTWLVGDWVGEEGMLLDASLSSAETVAQRILSAGGSAAAA